MGHRGVVGFILVAAVLMPSCSAGSEGPAGDSEDQGYSLFEVRQMLRGRAAALARGDTKSFLKPVSPEAAAVEQQIADGSKQVPLTAIQLVFRPARSVSLDAKSFAHVPTDFIFRYKGLPEDNNFRFRLFYDVERRKGQWTVTKSEIDKQSTIPDWVNGPVEVKHSAHFLVLHRPGVDRVPEAMEAAESARAGLAGKLSLIPDDKHLMLLARDHEEFQAFAGKPQSEGVLALARAASDDGGFPRNREMIVDLQAVLDPTGLAAAHGGGEIKPTQVFQHELGHLFLMRYNSALTPLWVLEGAAMFLSGERRADAWNQMLQQGFLERDLTSILVPGEQEDPLEALLYPYANAVVSYLAETYGAERFWDLYRSFKRVDQDNLAAGTVGRAQVEATQQLLRRVYRLSEQELDLRVRGWIKKQLAQPVGKPALGEARTAG